MINCAFVFIRIQYVVALNKVVIIGRTAVVHSAAADTSACFAVCSDRPTVDDDGTAVAAAVLVVLSATTDTRAVSATGRCGNNAAVYDDGFGVTAAVFAAATANTGAVSVACRRNDTAVDGNCSAVTAGLSGDAQTATADTGRVLTADCGNHAAVYSNASALIAVLTADTGCAKSVVRVKLTHGRLVL